MFHHSLFPSLLICLKHASRRTRVEKHASWRPQKMQLTWVIRISLSEVGSYAGAAMMVHQNQGRFF